MNLKRTALAENGGGITNKHQVGKSAEYPARFYEKSARGVRCYLCPHRCNLEEGETGKCRTRVNKGGELFTRAYGNPCAVHADPIEKKPLYHFLPGSKSLSIATAGCNLACLNCQNWQISQAAPNEVRTDELMPGQVAELALARGCQSVAYTYTDPVVFYEYVLDSAKAVHAAGLKNVIVSAGYIEEKPLQEWCRYIDGANIDLKSFSNEIYKKLSSAALKPVLNTLKVLKDEGVWVEITNLIIPRWTDDMEMIRRMCGWLVENGFEASPLHFSRFVPTYKLDHLPVTPFKTLNAARNLALAAGLKFVYTGNVPGQDATNTHCPHCQTRLIERSGFRVTGNNLSSGKCNACGESVPGVW